MSVLPCATDRFDCGVISNVELAVVFQTIDRNQSTFYVRISKITVLLGLGSDFSRQPFDLLRKVQVRQVEV
jgi:hypothetical protein